MDLFEDGFNLPEDLLVPCLQMQMGNFNFIAIKVPESLNTGKTYFCNFLFDIIIDLIC